MAKNGMLERELLTDYAEALGMRPEASVASKLTLAWNDVGASRTENFNLHPVPCVIAVVVTDKCLG